MLPPPNTYRQPRSGGIGLGTGPSGGGARIYFPSPSSPSLAFGPYTVHSSSLFSALRSRARLTNLGVSILSACLLLSVLLNLSFYRQPSTIAGWRNLGIGHLGYKSEGWTVSLEQYNSGRPLSIESTIERDKRYAELGHLIMVPGHAIWTGHDPVRILQDEQWVLQPMQKGGSVRTFVKHIEEGAERLRKDPKSLLVFSGGATRAHPAPPMSEAYSYHRLASTLDLFASHPSTTSAETPLPVHLRAVTEEFALDSYENLLFSIARFREVSGRYPSRITVVGYGMKARRFTDLHRAAIGWPLSLSQSQSSNEPAWEYVGINDEGDTTDQYAGELKFGYTPFLSNPSGCQPPLSIKRVNRNPFAKYHPYHTSCPELVGLLEWCPPAKVVNGDDPSQMERYQGEVPWREKAIVRGYKPDRME